MGGINIILIIASALLYGFLILRREVFRDFMLWEAGRYNDIKHGKRWRFRVLLLIPVVIALTLSLQPHGWKLIVSSILVSGILVAALWWLFFDGWFNNKRRFHWWFAGTDDPEDAKSDDIIQALQLWQHIALKVGGSIVLITLYILIFIYGKN